MHANFSSSKCITVTDHHAKSCVDPVTKKLSPFQDVEDIEFEDVCDDDYSQLDIFSLELSQLYVLDWTSLRKVFLLTSC